MRQLLLLLWMMLQELGRLHTRHVSHDRELVCSLSPALLLFLSGQFGWLVCGLLRLMKFPFWVLRGSLPNYGSVWRVSWVEFPSYFILLPFQESVELLSFPYRKSSFDVRWSFAVSIFDRDCRFRSNSFRLADIEISCQKHWNRWNLSHPSPPSFNPSCQWRRETPGVDGKSPIHSIFHLNRNKHWLWVGMLGVTKGYFQHGNDFVQNIHSPALESELEHSSST